MHRQIIRALVGRLAEGRATTAQQRDTADLIFGLTGFAMFRLLAPGRPAEAVCVLVKAACDDKIRRMLAGAADTRCSFPEQRPGQFKTTTLYFDWKV